MRFPSRLPSFCRLAVLRLLALAALVACEPAASRQAARDTRDQGDVVVAVVWPWDVQQQVRFAEGLDLAVEEINQTGGIDGRPIRLLREDDNESVNDGLLIAQRIADNPDVVAVIGHLQSYVSVPAAAIYDRAGIVMLAPASTAPELTSRGYTRVFRSTFTDEDTGRRLADFAADRGYRRLAIYYVGNAYGRTLANVFEEWALARGLTITARASYDAGQDEDGSGFEPVLNMWKRIELDAILVAGQVPLAGRLIARIRANGIDAPIIGGDAMGAPSLIGIGGEAVEGTVVTSSFHPEQPQAEVRQFVKAFRDRYDVSPDAGSALGYDAVRLLAHAMRLAGSTTPDSVARVLHGMQPWRGVIGDFSFDDHGNWSNPQMVMIVVEGGQFDLLETAADAVAGRTP